MPALHRNDLVPAGSAHPLVREFLDIKRQRARDQSLVALEGLWALRHALTAPAEVRVVFACPGLFRGSEPDQFLAQLHGSSRVTTLQVSERLFRRMSDRDGPDGLAAVARLAPAGFDSVPLGSSTVVVVADATDKAGNLGTLLRCADGAGASAVLVTSRRISVGHPLVVKASMGTILSMPVIDAERPAALAWLRAHGFRLIAADPAGRVSYRRADYRGPVALIVGSERDGLGDFWRAAADVVVSIPMLGVADSLNVGHAAALLLYEALHQRTGERP